MVLVPRDLHWSLILFGGLKGPEDQSLVSLLQTVTAFRSVTKVLGEMGYRNKAFLAWRLSRKRKKWRKKNDPSDQWKGSRAKRFESSTGPLAVLVVMDHRTSGHFEKKHTSERDRKAIDRERLFSSPSPLPSTSPLTPPVLLWLQCVFNVFRQSLPFEWKSKHSGTWAAVTKTSLKRKEKKKE